jgi:hypothetical protein
MYQCANWDLNSEPCGYVQFRGWIRCLIGGSYSHITVNDYTRLRCCVTSYAIDELVVLKRYRTSEKGGGLPGLRWNRSP